MMNSSFLFGTLRYLLITYTILSTCVAHYLNNNCVSVRVPLVHASVPDYMLRNTLINVR